MLQFCSLDAEKTQIIESLFVLFFFVVVAVVAAAAVVSLSSPF